MSNRMNEYFENADRFTAVVAAGDEDRWDSPSPCEEWKARDVLGHVVDTQRDFLGKRGADLGERPDGPPPQVWAEHQDAVRRACADDAFVTETFDGYFGPTTVADMLADFYGFDMLVHRWDLAQALGQQVVLDDEELDRMEAAMAGLGDQLYTEGVCKPARDVGEDASRQERVLGRLGRAPLAHQD